MRDEPFEKQKNNFPQFRPVSILGNARWFVTEFLWTIDQLPRKCGPL